MDLMVNNSVISTDELGRFSLVDLWKASGAHEQRKPARFFALDSTAEMIEKLIDDKTSFEPAVRKAGRYGGSWVCKELVYEYAMWCSVEFRLKVIRAFDCMVQKSKCQPTMRTLNDLTKRIESDKQLASACAKELAAYKKVKKKNQDDFIEAVNAAQMAFGFTELKGVSDE